jgi:hypothetical protein
MNRVLAFAAAVVTALSLAPPADAARLDPANFGYAIDTTAIFTGDYSLDGDPDFGFVSVEGAGVGGSTIINGIPPFAAADYDILLNGTPVPPNPGSGLLGPASILGDDGDAGFDLIFEALSGFGGAALPAGNAIFASVTFDTREADPGVPGFAFGTATTRLSLLVPAPVIPLPASGLLLLGAVATLGLRRRRG